MKKSSLLTASLLVALASFGASGCGLFQHSSVPDATKPVGGKAINLVQFRDDVQATRSAVTRTRDALARLPDSPNAQDAYASYSTELAGLARLIDKTSRESAVVRNSGKALFAQWSAETAAMNNSEIRAIAETRRMKLEAAYHEMITPLINARAHFTPLLSDLNDLQKALALDLTPAGIKALQPLVTKLVTEADETTKSLDDLAANLNKIASALPQSTVGPAN